MSAVAVLLVVALAAGGPPTPADWSITPVFGPPVAVLAAIAAASAAMTANPMPFFICTSSSGFCCVRRLGNG